MPCRDIETLSLASLCCDGEQSCRDTLVPGHDVETLFFWMNKNLFPKGQNPTKNTHEVKKTPKKRKTDSTSPKTEEKGHQPETKIHLINGSQSPTYGHNQHKQPIKPPAPNTHIRAQPTKQPSKPHSPG